MSLAVRVRTKIITRTAPATLEQLLAEIRACRVCAHDLPHGARPVLRASQTARVAICGQAPGTKVHATGIPYDDASGKRLREWLGLDAEAFYDERRIAIVPMGFCFPGQDAKGGDLPPRKECAPLWHERLFGNLKQIELKLLVGAHAQAWHLKGRLKANMTETVRAWAEYLPGYVPLPHPSWRNNGWLKANPWFAAELLPEMRARVKSLL
jgi:uracil-DNA glycosylase